MIEVVVPGATGKAAVWEAVRKAAVWEAAIG